MDTNVIPLVDEGLGNTAYLTALGDGRALAVDASRDLRQLRAAAERRGLKIAYAAETHLHADFLSGARQLAADDGATILASAMGDREFPHVGLHDEEEVDLGGLTLRILTTPGHTLEHIVYVLLDGDRPLGVFTGGSLIVGSAARTDLVDPDRTVELAHLQYASLQRLITLPDATHVWPTHGAGSFCSAPPGAERTSTIGTEKRTNTLLRSDGPDAFAANLVAGLGSHPSYFADLPEVNRRGPVVVGERPSLQPVGPEEVARAGGVVVDVRPVLDFARGHVPGSVSNPLRGQFATWLGWTVPAGTPVAFVRNPAQDPDEIVWQALKVGYDAVLGELTDEWRAVAESVEVIGPAEVGADQVIDVRQESEFATGHLPGARNVELGGIEALTPGEEPLVVMCGHGERAATGASLLIRRGHRKVRILSGGPGDWSRLTGMALEHGR
ncbi:MBL fold metallo-hydrolase [Herbidospora yilanensis]|uniref:MBL fold metallo-hydrolase n=1 Tax=Herbidospora yilanensis TaxID=354426 RepID=UPI000AB68B60|nr:MBL fold metallo-hydrolase [Herbidospora yilanensis]